MKTHFALKPFAPQSILDSITSTLQRKAPTKFIFEFKGIGDIDSLNFSDERSEGSTWGQDLWKKSCFEFFLGIPQFKFYWEWNFSPRGQVSGYKFSDYRSSSNIDSSIISHFGGQLQTSFISDAKSFQKQVEVDFACDNTLAWGLFNSNRLDLNVSCILKLKNGETQYWAAKHGAEKADFHDRNFWIKYRL